MKANNSSFAWLVYCKILLLLVVFALEVSTVKAGNEHVFTDTIPIVEHEGHILMPVTINHKLKHLVFDTGSMYLSLWSKDITSKMKSIRNSSDSVKKSNEYRFGSGPRTCVFRNAMRFAYCLLSYFP